MSTLQQARDKRAVIEDAATELEDLHLEMMQEIGAATEDKTNGHYIPKDVGGAWELIGAAKPKNAELFIASLVLLFKVSAMIPPKHGESPTRYVYRVAEWINDRWRERGFK